MHDFVLLLYLFVETEGDEGGMKALHCWEKVVGERLIIEGQHLVPDGDAGDVGGRKVRLYVGLNPLLRRVWIAHPS